MLPNTLQFQIKPELFVLRFQMSKAKTRTTTTQQTGVYKPDSIKVRLVSTVQRQYLIFLRMPPSR